MKKLRLDSDALRVESFDTRTLFDVHPGTVRAHSDLGCQASFPDQCLPGNTDDPQGYTCGGQQSCNGSCNCGSAGCGSVGCGTNGCPTVEGLSCAYLGLSCVGINC
jgi:hypothetical protein